MMEFAFGFLFGYITGAASAVAIIAVLIWKYMGTTSGKAEDKEKGKPKGFLRDRSYDPNPAKAAKYMSPSYRQEKINEVTKGEGFYRG